jgi:hypothetical protein
MGDICVKTGVYTDSQGNEKGRYEKMGAWFQDDQGRISVLITMIPLMPPLESGKGGFFASLFPAQNNNRGAGHSQGQGQGQQQNRPPVQQQQQPQGQPPANNNGGYEDVPF